MSNLNKAMLIGRLTKDPEMRYTPSGTAVTNFSIATNRWSSGPDGEKKEFTDYHNIVAYPIGKRNLAETVAQYTRKGALVYVEGRIQTRSWEGQDGQKRRVTEIIANDVQFLEPAALRQRSRQDPPASRHRHLRAPPATSHHSPRARACYRAASVHDGVSLRDDLSGTASHPRPDASSRARRAQHESADDRSPWAGVRRDSLGDHGRGEARLQDFERPRPSDLLGDRGPRVGGRQPH